MGFVVEASYVGNRGTRLPVNRDINATPAQYLSTSPTRDQTTINYLGASFPNPFFGLNPQYTQTITRANLLRPYPQFGTITYQDPDGYSWYHALQSRRRKTLRSGLHIAVGIHMVEGYGRDYVPECIRYDAVPVAL